jgi:hypothetical protein
MAMEIEFEGLEVNRDGVKIFRTPLPQRDSELVVRQAASLGVRGRLQEDARWSIIRDRTSILQVFAASRCLRWTRLSRSGGEPAREVELPTQEDAPGLAESFLREQGLEHDLASFRSLSFTTLTRTEEGQDTPVEYPVALHVNFGFELDELPVFGPGAKIQVTFNGPDTVGQILWFWRDVEEDRVLDILAPDLAADLLRRSVAPDGVQDAVRIVLAPPRLGYYALSPHEAQRYLIPAYEFEGSILTDDRETYRFIRYVASVQVEADEVKSLTAFFGGASRVF